MTSMYGDLGRPPLNRQALVRALTGDGSRWTEIRVNAAEPSTNAALATLARTDPRDGLVLLTEHQTAGRGRLDRVWVSPPRAGVTMSVLVRPREVPVARWPWLPLLAGLAVAAALRQVTDVAATLKWPNDVMVDDRKVAGLLVERVEHVDAAEGASAAAVIGMGINVSTTRDELPTEQATSLSLEGASSTDRLTIVKAVLRRLDGLLSEWEANRGTPSQPLRDAYRSACSTIGRQVRVELPRQPSVIGIATDIDESGRLVVETASGTQIFGAGDVLHLRPTT